MGSGLADLDFFGAIIAILIWLVIPFTFITLILFLPALLIRQIFHLNLSKLKLLLIICLVTIAVFVAAIPFLDYLLPIMGSWLDKVL